MIYTKIVMEQSTPDMAGTVLPRGEVLISIESGPRKSEAIRSCWPGRERIKALEESSTTEQNELLLKWYEEATQ